VLACRADLDSFFSSGEILVRIQIRQIVRLVILASAASALVGCEWITRVDSTGYNREVTKDGKELFCKNVGAGPGGGDCYTRHQLWDKQNEGDTWWFGNPLAASERPIDEPLRY
jgi:hypothetical protein